MLPTLSIEATSSWEDQANFVWSEKGNELIISVAEEQAMDSYNVSITCKLTATKDQAIRLRDWLNGLGLKKDE